MAFRLTRTLSARNFIQAVVLIAGALIALVLFFSENQTLKWMFTTLALFAIGWAVVLAWSKSCTDPAQVLFLRRIFVLSFALRLAFLLALYTANQVYNYPLFLAQGAGSFADDIHYHEHSEEIAYEIKNHGFMQGLELAQAYYLGNFGYAYMTAVIYHVLGEPNTMVIRIVNILLGALSPILCFFIAGLVYDNERISRLSALFTALYPSFIVLSALQYKDTSVIFLTLMVIWYALRAGSKMIPGNIGPLLISLLILATFRSIIAISLLALIMMYLIARRGMKPSTVFIISSFIIISFSLVYWLIKENYFQFYYLTNLLDITEDVKYQYLRSPAAETSLMARFGSQDTFMGSAVMNFMIFMVAPLPNPNLGILKFALPGVWMWYFLIPLSIYGLYHSVRYVPKDAWLLTTHVLIVFCMIMISTFVSNFRYRTLIMPILLMFAAIGIHYFERIKALYLAYFIMVPLIASAYLYIKHYG